MKRLVSFVLTLTLLIIAIPSTSFTPRAKAESYLVEDTVNLFIELFYNTASDLNGDTKENVKKMLMGETAPSENILMDLYNKILSFCFDTMDQTDITEIASKAVATTLKDTSRIFGIVSGIVDMYTNFENFQDSTSAAQKTVSAFKAVKSGLSMFGAGDYFPTTLSAMLAAAEIGFCIGGFWECAVIKEDLVLYDYNLLIAYSIGGELPPPEPPTVVLQQYITQEEVNILWEQLYFKYYVRRMMDRLPKQNSGGNTPPAPIVPTSIQLSPDVRTMFMNESFTITATVLPSNAADKTITFQSVDPNIVTVSSSGVVTAKSYGATRVHATTTNGVFATCFITVLPYRVFDHGKEYTLEGYLGNETHVVIPDYVNGKPVTGISPACFSSSSICSVTLSETIKSISSPIDVSESIEYFYIDENNPHYTSVDGIVYSKDKNVLVASPSGRSKNVIVPEGTEEISNNAFYGQDFEEITLPQTLKTIDYEAFSFCSSLKQIDIPNSVTFIGYGAFMYCSALENVHLPNNITMIPAFSFAVCTNLKQIKIPSSVDTIEGDAFNSCENLQQIEFPPELKYIGRYAFSDCIKLKEITLPDTVSYIDEYAFANCYEMNTPLPKSLEVIGVGAFLSCGLTNIVIPENITSINDDSFLCCTNVQTIQLSNQLENIGAYAFNSCHNLQYIHIPNTVSSIGDYAFGECYSLEYAEVPASVTSIGANAFTECAENFKMYVEKNSYAHTYAIQNNIPYVFIGDELTSDTYTIQDNLVQGIKVFTTVQEFLARLDETLYAVVYDQNGEICQEDDYITTNTIIRVEYNGDVRHEYAAVIRGDVDADGKINTSDAVLSLMHALKYINLQNDALETAADFNGDGIVNTLDARFILKAIVSTP